LPQQSKQTGALIDAPVGPYSDPNDIRAWIDELRAMPSISRRSDGRWRMPSGCWPDA